MNMATRFVHRLTIPLVFPAGLAPGAGKDGGNLLALATDGAGKPVLRGTAIAGVLRHAWARAKDYDASALGQHNEVARWFGYALGDDASPEGNHNSLPSPLRVADAPLFQGASAAERRQHNSIDRHSGSVREGGLFTLEALPPQTKATVVLHLHLHDETGAEDFLKEILGLVKSGLTFGGHGARGVGLARLDGEARHRRFELRDINDCAAALDESWAWRNERPDAFTGDAGFKADPEVKSLHVTVNLAVPRGQDICIGSGMGVEFPIEPQKVTAADGKSYWRLPGSSLRGCFRAWFARLAARAALQGKCKPPTDSLERLQSSGEVPSGDEVGRLFHDRKTFKVNVARLQDKNTELKDVVTCPVASLFGSLYNAGRLHIADALSAEPVQAKDRQHRKHVAVDRITGGASEGGLFDHAALLTGPRFTVEIVIHEPTELEAEWLADTLRAIDTGLIRIGCSKSAGRLALAETPKASGQHHKRFGDLNPSEA
jgi:CRISPR/Cas system CSM-associated protein Csm3 (group 7 of RAMP superfamily)